ncbi:MAG: hypothetical protein E6J94_08520 [Methanobacteriota archaeon]|nr:MAG: hypothetical protein E6J94_08520 [Euryarchaeota archaeon]
MPSVRSACRPPDMRSVVLGAKGVVERGKRLEADALNGAVERLGARHGLSMPVSSFLNDLLKLEDEKDRLQAATQNV